MSAPAVIQVEGLAKRFGYLTALDDIALEAPAGSVIGLLGPNGAREDDPRAHPHHADRRRPGIGPRGRVRRRRRRRRPAGGHRAGLLLIFASSAFVALETMPAWLQAIARYQPVTVTIDAVRAAFAGQPPPVGGSRGWPGPPACSACSPPGRAPLRPRSGVMDRGRRADATEPGVDPGSVTIFEWA